MSATGSVNLIVCFSLSHPFAPRPAENLQQLVHHSFVVSRFSLAYSLAVANDQRPAANDPLPRRLRNPWNFPAQRQLAEAQAANAELAQEAARPSAKLAAVMPARGKNPAILAAARLAFNRALAFTDGAWLVRPLHIFRALVQPNAILHSFCCRCH